MENTIKACDIFTVQPGPSIQGKQYVSKPISLVFSVLVVIATVWISLNSISLLWLPVADLPVSSGIGSTQNMTFSPFIIAMEYFYQEDKELINISYGSDFSALIQIICPLSLIESIDELLMRCFQTKPIQIDSDEEIVIYAFTSVRPKQVLIQKFSLDTQLGVKQPYLFQNFLISIMYNFIGVTPVKLTIKNSLLGEFSSYQNVGILDYSSVYKTFSIDTGIFAGISFNKVDTCLQYKINRDSFLTILAAVTSWFQSISGAAAVLIIFNQLVLKQMMGRNIFISRSLQNKKSIIKLYTFYLLDLIKIGTFLNKNFGLFRIQALITQEIDKKVSLENICRMITFNNKKSFKTDIKIRQIEKDHSEMEPNNKSVIDPLNQYQNIMNQKDINNISKSDQTIIQKQNINNKLKKINNLLPFQQQSIISKFIQKINFNSINVTLSLDQKFKSSVLSVTITIIGAVLVSCLLWYFGAFDPKELRESKYMMKQDNSLQIGVQNNKFFISILNSTGEQIFIDQQNDDFIFLKFDKNYQIIQKYKPTKNCTDQTISISTTTIFNYCLDQKVVLNCNQSNLQRIGFMFNQPQQYEANIYFKTASVQYDNISFTLAKHSMPLLSLMHQEAFFRKTHFINKNNQSSYTEVAFLQNLSTGLCGDAIVCLVITLVRQQYFLTILEDSPYYIFCNLWSTTYLLFSFLLIFLILPYNSNISKSNIFASLIDQQQKQQSLKNTPNAQIEQIYQISSIIQLLESKTSLKQLPYTKTLIQY